MRPPYRGRTQASIVCLIKLCAPSFVGTSYTPAFITSGGRIDIEAGRDLILEGSFIDGASAEIDVGRDLIAESLQDTFESESNSFGFSATITPGVGITGGSVAL